jgi:hypothetical protein
VLEEGVVVVFIDKRSGSLGAADIDGEGGHGQTLAAQSPAAGPSLIDGAIDCQ